jgi:outer membrane murein-binding lipoprotein Lpp
MAAQPPGAPTDLDRLRRENIFAAAQEAHVRSSEFLKWTIASLLVVNGGALVALIGSQELRTVAFSEAVYYFAGGMLSVLVSAVLWAFSTSSQAMAGLRRAWDPRPLEESELSDIGLDRPTMKLGLASFSAMALSFVLFVFGCISTSFVPERARADALHSEWRDAMAKEIFEGQRYIGISTDVNATREERKAAEDRYRAARLESLLRWARVARATGEEDHLLNEVTALGNRPE